MDLNHHFSPSMLTYPEPSEFDYSAFLNTGDDLAYQQAQAQLHLQSQSQILSPHHAQHAQLSPLGAGPGAGFSDSSIGRATTPSSDTRSTSTDLVSKSQQKQRLERRGHTKSRRGCYNCKRRRIKVRIGLLTTLLRVSGSTMCCIDIQC